MTLRTIKKIIAHYQKPNQLEKDGHTIAIAAYKISYRTYIVTIILGAIGIIIAFTYGHISKRLSEAQLEISKKQDTATQMLIRQDKIIEELQKEVRLSEDVKKSNDNANKYRFISALFKLGAIIGDRTYAEEQLQSIDGVWKYVNEVAPILEGQLNNPFLNQNDTMLNLWTNGYIHLLIVGQDDEYLMNNDGKQYITDNNGKKIIGIERQSIPVDKISKVVMKRSFIHAWESINEAYIFCGRKMKYESDKFIRK